MCSENQKPLPCTISHSDTTLKLQKDGSAVMTHKPSGPITLTYFKKSGHGIVHIDGPGKITDPDRILEFLIISKEQFDKITTIVRTGLSLTKLESDRLNQLRSDLYISVKHNDEYTTVYRINQFRHIKTKETEYTSDLDASESESETDAVMDAMPVAFIFTAIVFAIGKGLAII